MAVENLLVLSVSYVGLRKASNVTCYNAGDPRNAVTPQPTGDCDRTQQLSMKSNLYKYLDRTFQIYIYFYNNIFRL
jgi:hypothetical protein